MKKLTRDYFFGIDTSKKKLDFAFAKGLDYLNNDEVENNYKSIKSWLLAKLEAEKISLDQCVFCIEQTGIYCKHLIKVLLDLDAWFTVVHSAHIKLSWGLTRGKSDEVDAKRIAEYACRFQDKLIGYQPKRAIVEKLDVLCKQRRKFVKMKSQITVPLQELETFGTQENYELSAKHSAKVLESIELAIDSISKQIKQLIKSEEPIRELSRWIGSVVGLGDVATPTVIVATNEFTNGFTAKQMCSHSGVAPFPNSSGSSLKGKDKVSHKANKELKTLFHLCAMAAIRTNSDLARFYHRKLAEGKSKMSALNAVRNKIIHRIFAVVREERMYEKEYVYRPSSSVVV